MAASSKRVVTLREARARLSELVEEVNAEGGETILTRNGEACAALIGVERLEHYHRLEREHVRLTLLVEALRGLDDLEKSETVGLSELRSRLGSSDSGA